MFEDDRLGDLLPVNVGLGAGQRLQSDHHCTEKTGSHGRKTGGSPAQHANTPTLTVTCNTSRQLLQRQKKKA